MICILHFVHIFVYLTGNNRWKRRRLIRTIREQRAYFGWVIMSGEEKKSVRFEFPSMLYDLLEDVSDDPARSGIVSWMPHGRAFRVHDGNKFDTDVMPNYFRERYASFRLLLEQWGFVGLRKGKDRGAYYSLKFVRGQRNQIANVTKEEMFKALPTYTSPRDEPDFYSMPPAVWTTPHTSQDKDEWTEQKTTAATEKGKAIKSKTTPARISKKSHKVTKGRPSASRTRRAHEVDEPRSTSSAGAEPTSSDSSNNIGDRRRSMKRPARASTGKVPSKKFKRPVASISNDGLSTSEGDSDSKVSADFSVDSTAILLAPTNAVFSGFNLPSKNTMLIIVKKNEDLGGEEPFNQKRPIAAKN
jgi:HSF-type DNA-binding